jgi:hypothetical protein
MNAIVAAVTDDRFADILFCLLGVSHRAKCELIQRVKQPMMSSAGPGAARALPAKWEPVRRRKRVKRKESRTVSDSNEFETALAALTKGGGRMPKARQAEGPDS